MKKSGKMRARLGDLIVALYDEAEKEARVEKFQSAIVAIALLDLSKRIIRSKHEYSREHKKVA